MKTINNLYSVKGNHDQHYLNICSGLESEERLVNKYGNAYKNIERKISQANKQFVESMLEKLELECLGSKIGVFHGSPCDPINGRVYPDTEISYSDGFSNYDYVILGHTHYRMIRYIDSTVVINPGSIGQPRDKNGFGFATLSLPSGDVEFHEVTWDRNLLVSDIKRNDNGNKKLIDILYRNEEM